VFLSGVVLSFFYTAGPVSLKCRALGDVVIFACFGPLLMQFTALLSSPASSPAHLLQWQLLPYTIPLGLLTEAILHANNSRDIEMDGKAGILTVAGLLGYDASRVLFIGMIALSYLASAALAVWSHWGNCLVFITLPLAHHIIGKFTPQVSQRGPALCGLYLDRLYSKRLGVV
jgi:1,4-dihydroxy-2-naphthoate octaprenyltransferase